MKDWEYDLRRQLREYSGQKIAAENLQERIAELSANMTGIRSARTGGSPVMGGVSRREDMYINGIVRLDELKFELALVTDALNAIDKGMRQIATEDRRILDLMYIRNMPIDAICKEYCADRATVYRKSKIALTNLALVMYGR